VPSTPEASHRSGRCEAQRATPLARCVQNRRLKRHGKAVVGDDQGLQGVRLTRDAAVEKYFIFRRMSRVSEVSPRTCGSFVERFARYNFSFFVGCADAVDCSFRLALSCAPFGERCFAGYACSGRRKRSRSPALSRCRTDALRGSVGRHLMFAQPACGSINWNNVADCDPRHGNSNNRCL